MSLKRIDFNGGRHAILLLHGLYGNPQEMQYVGRKLNRAGYTVSIPYIRGCGAADGLRETWRTRWEHWLAQAEEEFDRIKSRSDAVSVGGLCAGANLALGLAIKRSSEIHSQFLYSATLYYDGWNLTRLRFLRTLGYHTPLRYVLYFHEREPYGLKDERIRQWIAAQMKKGGATAAGASKSSLVGVYQNERLMRHLKKNMGAVQTPTLILHAREDDTTSLRSANLVESMIASPVKRMTILENSYHIITMDHDKDVVVEETLDFIEGVSNQVPSFNLQAKIA